MANKISREVDLTHNLIFQKDNHIHTRSTNITTSKQDPYKRYHEYERPMTYTTSTLDTWNSTISNFVFDQTSSTIHISTNQTYDIDLFKSINIDRVEERVCWRPLKKSYETIRIVSSDEELSQITSQFPMGSREERSKILKPVIDRRYFNTCECCRCPYQT